MTFNFVAGAAAAPAPGASGFGSNATNAPTSAAPTFGATNTTNPSTSTATAPATAPPFSFGGSPAPAASPAATTTATFGAATAAAPPAGGTFGNFNTNTTAAQPTQQNANLLQASHFSTRFPGSHIWQSLSPNLLDPHHGHLLGALGTTSDNTSIASRLLQAIHTVEPIPAPNTTLRQQLVSQRRVRLASGVEAPLTQQMMQDILWVADEGKISEADALALYHQASQQPQQSGDDIKKVCFRLYQEHRTFIWQAWELLCATRVSTAAVAEATDAILFPTAWTKFVSYIRDSSARIHETIQQVRVLRSQDRNVEAMDRYLQRLVWDRQMASNCLYLTAYSTQLKADEVAALIDLVRDLTNGSAGTDGLIRLDPYTDVPDPYEQANPTQSMWVATERREKSQLSWQKELVATVWNMGQPQLLRCVSTLVMAVLCALDTQSVLLNRETHQLQATKGNALVPTEATSTESLRPLQDRLSKSAVESWNRSEILGLLMAAYGMLLRSCPSALASPRMAPASPAGGTDIRKTWRECIQAPSDLKSFSFARLTLLPGLQIPSNPATNYQISEFLLASLSEFTAKYLDAVTASGHRPVSRAKWEQDAESQLRYRRENQERESMFRRQFHQASTNPMEAVPDSLDLLTRPDCMDDTFAFASAVCAMGPDYALQFWAREETVSEGALSLVPSRALRDLKEQQSLDDSLRPSYLSFLAALALAKNDDGSLNGADAVHELLRSNANLRAHGAISYPILFENLRYYARELSPSAFVSTTSSSTETKTSGSTAYYYFDNNEDSRTATRTSDTARRRKRELGEENKFIVLSHLALISTVASNSPLARCFMLSTKLPVEVSDGRGTVGQDSVLMILLSLSVTALEPFVRGQVFRTVSALLKYDDCRDETQKKEVREAAKSGWELVEAYLILPIHLLEQYTSVQIDNTQEVPCLAFPQSSTSLATSKVETSWIPADPKYSIIYEMEYVESVIGVYESTVGFVTLLKSLVCAGGCPASLGSTWRLRTGSTPYIEYILDLILPRITGTGKFSDLSPLSFRTTHARNSLVGSSMELLESVLARFLVPVPGRAESDLYKEHTTMTRAMLGHDLLANSLVVSTKIHDSGYADLGRTKHESTEITTRGTGVGDRPGRQLQSSALSTSDQNVSVKDLPPTMSPGMSILSNLLSPQTDVLKSVLVAFESLFLAASVVESDSFGLAFSLYGSTRASLASAKKACMSSDVSRLPRQATLQPLQPVAGPSMSAESTEWKERSILASLRLLCAAAAREKIYQATLESSTRRMHAPEAFLIPLLRFQSKNRPSSQLRVVLLQNSPLSEQIFAASTRSSIVSCLAECVSLQGTCIQRSFDVASASIALTFHVAQELGSQKSMRFFGDNLQKVSKSFGEELRFCSQYIQTRAGAELVKVILDKIVLSLRASTNDSFTDILLGTLGELQGLSSPVKTPQLNCLDAILEMLDSDSVPSVQEASPSLASTCYEILFLLTSSSPVATLRRAEYVAKRLQVSGFWQQRLFDTVRHATSHYYHIHCIAWILKGLGVELALLSRSPTVQPEAFSTLLQVITSFVRESTSLVPMKKVVAGTSVQPTEDLLRPSKLPIEGPAEVVMGYQLIDPTILFSRAGSISEERRVAYESWIAEWNEAALRDCAAAHVTRALHVVLASASVTVRDMRPYFSTSSSQPWIDLLLHLGRAMSEEGQALDDCLSATATRHISFAMLALADLSTLSPTVLEDHYLSSAGNLLFKLIAASGAESTSGLVSSAQDERTATFANIVLLLFPDEPPERYGCNKDILYEAFLVLSRLAVSVPSTLSPLRLPAPVLIARSCLSRLIPFASSLDGSFCREWLTSKIVASSSRTVVVLDSFLKFIPCLDTSICPLLLEITSCQGGSKLLLERGVLDALLTAASTYANEERKVIAVQSGHSVELVTPVFLPGQLRLLFALLSSGEMDFTIIDDNLKKAFTMMATYSLVLKRLVETFPRDGNELILFARCIGKLNLSSRSTSTLTVPTDISLVGDYECHLHRLAMHIAENPLPRQHLKPFPTRLAKENASLHDNSVVAARHISSSWWDGLGANVDGNREEVCRLSSLGLEMSCHILGSARLLQEGSSRSLDLLAILRAICRCSDALQFAELYSQTLTLQSPLHQRDTSSVIHLKDVVGDFLEQLILLALDFSRNKEFAKAHGTKELVAATLDHSGLRPNNMIFGGRVGTNSSVADENSQNRALQLAVVLEREVASLL